MPKKNDKRRPSDCGSGSDVVTSPAEPRQFVYLDKFISLPHLPNYEGATATSLDVPPNLSHTGVRSVFEPQVTPSTMPTGSLTPQYLDRTLKTARQKSRDVIKLDKKQLMRSVHRRAPMTEQLLVNAEEKRLQFESLVKKQFDTERLVLGFPDFDRDGDSVSTMKFDSLDGGSSLAEGSLTSKSRRLKKIPSSLNQPRPKKIYNKTSLIQCIFDTTEFPICSTQSLKESSLNSITGGSSILTRNTNRSQASKWHPEAVHLAHGDLPLSRAVSPISRRSAR